VLARPILVAVLVCTVLVATAARRAHADERLSFHVPAKPLSADAVTSDWPAFLGPTHDGHCPETHLLKTWPDTGPTLIWELRTGDGYAAPSVVGHRLVLIHRVVNEQVVECRHAETGDLLWEFRYPCNYRDRYGYGDGPRGAPAIADSRVFTLGVEGKLHCLSLDDGELLWQRDLFSQYDMKQAFFGVGTSPLVVGRLVVVNIGASMTGGPCVLAMDVKSGEDVWRAGAKWGPSYATPVPAMLYGRPRLLVFTGGESRPPAGGLLCINPADGGIDFRFPWRSRKFESVNAANPVVIGDRVFVTASYQTGGALICIKSDFSHDRVWTTDELGAHFNTPIHKAGYLYGFDGRHQRGAELVCLSVETGKSVWRHAPEWTEIMPSSGKTVTMGTFRGCMIHVDGDFLCLGEFGHLLWLDLTPAGYGQIVRHWLFATPETWTPPVISRGLLYVMQNRRDSATRRRPRLLCYDLRGP
jgi:outer membrane protein assembly factor BamB